MTRLDESYITRCSSIFECIYFACDHVPSTNQSLKVRSNTSLALSLGCGIATSSCAHSRPMKSISTGRGPPRRYSSQKARLGASTSSHDPKRVESGTEEAGWGRLTGVFRWRLLRQLCEDMWPPRAWCVTHLLRQKGHV